MKIETPTLLPVTVACLALALAAPARATLLFQDDFNAANGNIGVTDAAVAWDGSLNTP